MAKEFKGADFKKGGKRKKDAKAMKELHLSGVYCVVCGEPGNLHHVLAKGDPLASGDDVPSNLVGLCGSGTTGCHGLYHAGDEWVVRALGLHVLNERPDFIFYLQAKLGEEAARSWLNRRLLLTL